MTVYGYRVRQDGFERRGYLGDGEGRGGGVEGGFKAGTVVQAGEVRPYTAWAHPAALRREPRAS